MNAGLADLAAGRFFRPAPRAAAYAAAAILAAALVLVVANSYRISFSGNADACCVSEWLINYEGGFVRRGLGGALILWITSAAGLSPRVVLFAILASCYVLSFASLAVMMLRVREVNYLELLLALSPFAALFPLFHGIAGQRKEVLMLALAGLAGTTDLGRLDRVAKYVGWSLAFAVLVAVHDGSVFFLPLFVIYLRVVTPPAYPMGYRALLLLLPAACVFLLGYIRSAHVDVAAICSAMQRSAQGHWCVDGATPGYPYAAAWLKASALDGAQSVMRRYTRSATVLPLTLLSGAAGLLPIVTLLRKDAAVYCRVVRDLPLQQLFLWLTGLGIALLFCVANDWNRWFYIATTMLTLVHFAARRDA